MLAPDNGGLDWPDLGISGFGATVPTADEKLQEEFLRHWRFSRLNRRFEPDIFGDCAHHAFNSILSRISEGVKSFCKAQPLAHLTTAKLTQASLGLASIFLYDSDKVYVEQTLKALFADPLIDNETVLRVFAATSVYQWTLGGSFGTLPEERPDSFRRSMNGRLLQLCQKSVMPFDD